MPAPPLLSETLKATPRNDPEEHFSPPTSNLSPSFDQTAPPKGFRLPMGGPPQSNSAPAGGGHARKESIPPPVPDAALPIEQRKSIGEDLNNNCSCSLESFYPSLCMYHSLEFLLRILRFQGEPHPHTQTHESRCVCTKPKKLTHHVPPKTSTLTVGGSVKKTELHVESVPCR